MKEETLAKAKLTCKFLKKRGIRNNIEDGTKVVYFSTNLKEHS